MGKHKTKKDKKDKDKKKKAAGDGEIDEETAQQVAEIEERLQILSEEMNACDKRYKVHQIEAKRSVLTKQEIDPYPVDTTMYRGVGRMFLKASKAGIQGSLQASAALKAVEMQQAKQTKDKIELKVKEAAENLRDLIGVERMRKLFDKPKPGGIVEDMQSVLNKDKGDEMLPIFGKKGENTDLPAITEENDEKDESLTADVAPAEA